MYFHENYQKYPSMLLAILVLIRGEFYMAHPVTYGKRVRMSYSRIKEVLELPDLIELTGFNRSTKKFL